MEPARQNSLWLVAPARPSLVLAMDDPRAQYASDLADLIIWLRVRQGITSQAELGKRVGVSESTARRWEAPEDPIVPDAWEINRLCEVLGVEAQELIHPRQLPEGERFLLRRASRATRRAGSGPS